jgi:hypothetical protein
MNCFYTLDKKKINLIKHHWDYLIILDACRYDFFKEVYKKYFSEGLLKKATSPASYTIEWLNKLFLNYYKDIIYISANPLINSRKETVWSKHTFNAKEHFYKIIDVWNFGWDEKIDIVPPQKVNQATYNCLAKYPSKRFIIHYIQPHDPYITKNYLKYLTKRINKLTERDRNKTSNKLKIFFGRKFRKTFGSSPIWKIYNLVFGGYSSQASAIYLREGWIGIRQAYKENLEYVLNYVRELIDNLPPGKIIITSDHGELLGEGRHYWHYKDIKHPKLREVPWLEINKRKILTEKEKLKKKIIDLKNKKQFLVW